MMKINRSAVALVVAGTFFATLLWLFSSGSYFSPSVPPGAGSITQLQTKKPTEGKELSAFRHAGTLSSAVATIQAQSDLRIVPVWKSLEQVDVTPDTPVGIQFERAMRLEKILSLLVTDVSHAGKEIGFVVRDDGIAIASKETLSLECYIEAYDVSTLTWTPTREPAASKMPRLVDVLQFAIEPAEWRELGGRVWSMREVNGTLLVNTTRDCHERLEKLLVRISKGWPSGNK